MENICFRDQSFLNTTPLTEYTILEYFSTSQFYDTSCTNEVLKMQTKFGDTTSAHTLQDLNGIQYILHEYNDDRSLFIIYKINRYGIDDFDVLVVYYVMFGNIYQSPINHSLFNGRLVNHFYLINEVLDLYEENLKFDMFKGFFISVDDIEHDVMKSEKKDETEFFFNVLDEFMKSKID